MHGLEACLDEARALAAFIDGRPPGARVAICPPATLIQRMADLLAGSTIVIGAQDCRAERDGAFTGDLSAEMLADAGASLVILGHSERRAGHGETDKMVAAKVFAALRAGLEPIVCVGETLDQRRAGDAIATVTAQVRASLPAAMKNRPFVIAYEPVWAIGSGLTPRLNQIEEVHHAIRQAIVDLFGAQGRAVPILYGGSVKPANAAQILHCRDIGGALVGGASLKAAEFAGIIEAI